MSYSGTITETTATWPVPKPELGHYSPHPTRRGTRTLAPSRVETAVYRTRALTGLIAAALIAVTGSVAFAAPGAAAGPQVEINSQNPVTAEPPVSRPPTHSCTETLATHFLSNDATTGAAQNFTGTLAPPADCAGPWAKVVLDWTTSVQGRQYDRSGSLDIGTTQVWFGTTYEPDPAGITYHFAKDITEYSAVLRKQQPFQGGIVNFTSDVAIYGAKPPKIATAKP